MANGLSPKLPIQRDAEDGYALTKTYEEMIIQNLKNLLLTVPGERMMDPLFGVGLKTFLFEEHDEVAYSNIHSKTMQQVELYMPFVEIQDMHFIGPDGTWSPFGGYLPGFEPSADAVANLLQIRIFLRIKPLDLSTALNLDVQL